MIQNIFKKFNKKSLGLSAKWQMVLLVVLVASSVLVVSPAHANVIEDVVSVSFGWITSAILAVLGKLIVQVIDVLVRVAEYNGFTTAEPVVQGWLIIRDICNMFFILILLIVAFATVLRYSKYNWRQLIPKVIIAAIMINFSRMICGLMIDVSQVIMLTFVAGFSAIAAGNFSNLLGVSAMTDIDPSTMSNSQGVSLWYVILGYVLAIIYALVALVVLLALLATLVIRVVYIWIYVILSPFYFFLNVLPSTTKYANMWMSRMVSELTGGPILAFFIWLSLASLGRFTSDKAAEFNKKVGFDAPDSQGNFQNASTVGITQAGTADHMMRFAISIAFLVGGLAVAKSTGGAAGTAAAAGQARIKRGANFMKRNFVKRPMDWGKKQSVAAAKLGARKGIGLAKGMDTAISRGLARSTVGQKLGMDANRERGYVAGAAAAMRANVFSASGLKENVINKPLRNVLGWERNDNINSTRYQATKDGKFKQGGVEYVKSDKDNYFYDKSGRRLKQGGVDIEAMSKFGADLYEGRRSTAMERKYESKKFSEEEKRVNKFKDEYKNLSGTELAGLFRSTGNQDRRAAIYLSALDKGKVADDIHREGDELLAHKYPGLLEKSREQLLEKQAHLAYNLENPADRSAFVDLDRKGKIGELVKQDHKDLPTKEVADFLDARMEAKGSDELFSQLKKVKKEGDDKQIKKYSEALEELISNKNKSVYDKSYEKSYQDTFNQERQSNIGKGMSEQAAEQAAQQTAQKIATDRASKSILSDKDLFNLRKAFLKMTGELAKSFTTKETMADGTTREVTSHDGIKNFVSRASANDLLDIDHTSRGFDEVGSHVASAMTIEKLKNMQRSNDNPELVRAIAEQMAKNNHPDAPKIINYYNDIEVNEDKADNNAVIQKVLRKVNNPNASDLSVVNEFRDFLDKTADANKAAKADALKNGDQKAADGIVTDFYKTNSKGKHDQDSQDAMIKELKRFITAKMASNVNPDDYQRAGGNTNTSGSASPSAGPNPVS